MGQAALKSRSHRRYYLNKVHPFLSSAVAKRLFFHLAPPVDRYENIDVPFGAKKRGRIIYIFDENRATGVRLPLSIKFIGLIILG